MWSILFSPPGESPPDGRSFVLHLGSDAVLPQTMGALTGQCKRGGEYGLPDGPVSTFTRVADTCHQSTEEPSQFVFQMDAKQTPIYRVVESTHTVAAAAPSVGSSLVPGDSAASNEDAELAAVLESFNPTISPACAPPPRRG